MKRILLFLVAVTTLFACKNNKPVEESILFTQDEKNRAIEILELYCNVDSQVIEERHRLYQLMLDYTEPKEMVTDEDRGYFLWNLAHIDSIVAKGIDFVLTDKNSELLNMLEAELKRFYGHPHNTVDNELALHELMTTLYSKKDMPQEEFFKKQLWMYNWSVMHCEMFETKPAFYTDLLMHVLGCNIVLEQYETVIQCGNKLIAHTLQTSDEEAQVYSTILLAYSYGVLDMRHQQDSCNSSIEHLKSLYPEACELAWQLLNR